MKEFGANERQLPKLRVMQTNEPRIKDLQQQIAKRKKAKYRVGRD